MEIQAIIDSEDLDICINGNGNDADIKKKFSEFFLASTNRELEIEVLNDMEKQARREQQKRDNIQEQQIRYKKEIMGTFTPADFKILELRKQGKSIFAICKSLGISKGKVEYKLGRMALIPELMEDVDKRFQPLTRKERSRLR